MEEVLAQIEGMMQKGRMSEVEKFLSEATSTQKISEADGHYLQGKVYMKQQRWGEAISSFLKAEAIDPQSPAREARLMLDDILSFYHKDSYNP